MILPEIVRESVITCIHCDKYTLRIWSDKHGFDVVKCVFAL